MTRRSFRLATRTRKPRLLLECLERRDVPSFFSAASYPAGAAPRALAAGDFNGDAVPDAAVANYGGSGGVSILLGVGDGSLQSAGHYNTGAQTRAITAGDVILNAGTLVIQRVVLIGIASPSRYRRPPM